VSGGTDVAGPRVWVIAAARGPRAALRAELIERGHDAVGFETLRDAALAARLPATPPPALVVIDFQDEATDDRVLDVLFATGAPVIAVTGATHEADARLRARPWARWLRRPLTVGTIADTVDALYSHLRNA
jgi:hypothetical protein